MNIHELYEEPSASDLDTELTAGSYMLQKAAADMGVDLNSLSETDVEELLAQAAGIPAKEASDMTTENQTQQDTENQLTYSDVALEIQKRASAEGLDLAELQKEEYEAIFDKVASEMQDPEYAEKVAEAEKLAAQEQWMDHLGRVAAQGFVSELEKVANEECPPEKGKKKDDGDEDEEPKEKRAGLKDMLMAAKGKAIDAGKKGVDFAKKHPKATAAGGAAVAGGVAGGVAAHMSKKEAALNDAATKLAAEILVANGYDPETGEKVAAASEEPTAEEIQKRAYELLAANGFQVKD